jgi:hypothetical protein
MLLLYAIAAGVLLGLARGGRLGALGSIRFRWWPLALFGLLFQLVLFTPPVAASVGDAGPLLYVGSTALVLIALLPNLRQPGFWLIGLGALLNLIVVVANGGQMPASPAGFAALTGVAAVPVDHFSNSTLIGPHTVLPLLGDIFLLPRPIPLANVFSIGDVLIGVGGALFIVIKMGRRPPVAEVTPQPRSLTTPQNG